MEYFNYITQDNESIDSAKDFYFIKSNELLFKFMVSPQAAEFLPRDAFTASDTFCRLTHRQLKSKADVLFPNKRIRSEPLCLTEITTHFPFALQPTSWASFGLLQQQEGSIRQHLAHIESSDDDIIKQASLYALLDCSMQKDTGHGLWALGVTESLIHLLRLTNNAVMLRAAIALLERLVLNECVRKTVRQHELIPFLVTLLLGSEDIFVKQGVINVLISLIMSQQSQAELCVSSDFPSLVYLTHTCNDRMLKQSLLLVLQVLTHSEDNHSYLRASGAVSLFVELLSPMQTSDVIKHALDALKNMGKGFHNRLLIRQANGVNALMILLLSSNDVTVKQAGLTLFKQLMINAESIGESLIIALMCFLLPNSLRESSAFMFACGAASIIMLSFLYKKACVISRHTLFSPLNAQAHQRFSFFVSRFEERLLLNRQPMTNEASEHEALLNV